MLSTDTKDVLATARGNTGTTYTTEGTCDGEWVNVIRAGEDNHGGRETHKGRKGGFKTRGKVNTTK